jgi:hypothetical protein
MADFDWDALGADCERVSNDGDGGVRRRKSGMVPRPEATPEQWAELGTGTAEFLAVTRRVELESGDSNIRALSDAIARLCERIALRSASAGAKRR